MRMNRKKITLIIVLLLIVDQVVKLLVKTHMTLDQSITVFPNWFFIRFIENLLAEFGFEKDQFSFNIVAEEPSETDEDEE